MDEVHPPLSLPCHLLPAQLCQGVPWEWLRGSGQLTRTAWTSCMGKRGWHRSLVHQQSSLLVLRLQESSFLFSKKKKKKNLSETMVLLLHLAFPIWGLELLRGRFPPADGEEAALPPGRLS